MHASAGLGGVQRSKPYCRICYWRKQRFLKKGTPLLRLRRREGKYLLLSVNFPHTEPSSHMKPAPQGRTESELALPTPDCGLVKEMRTDVKMPSGTKLACGRETHRIHARFTGLVIFT